MDIIIFGTGSTSEKLKKMLHNNIKIISYMDNNQDTWGFEKDNIPIINPIQIQNIKYDYVIIASQFSDEIKNQLLGLNVLEEKIIDFYFIINKEFNWVKSDINELTSNDIEFDGLITGLSYAKSGIKQELLKYNTYNLAHASQDLEEDYNIIEFILKKNTYNIRKIKFVLITLAYYSFHYDLSLSKMKILSKLYDDAFNKVDHSRNYKDKLNILKKIIDFALYKQVFFNNVDCVYEKYNWEEQGEKVSKIDCNKHYPKTVEKNKEIFRKYLELLKKNNIRPIVVILPATSYYTEYFSITLENEFKEIMKEFQGEFNFQYLDYFRSPLFGREDFRDVSHLNKKGAIKVTNMLNEDIEW